MDVLAIEAAYGALDGDEDVECAIALAHRCLLRASNMPAGRERRRIIREATDELCTALERNVMEDPDFSHQSTRASAPASRTSSRKRVRSRKVIIDSSDSEAEEPHAKKDENAGSADNVEEMDITENVGNALTVTPPTRRSTRLAENLEKEVERNQSEMESAMQEAAPTAPTPAQTADANADVNDGDSSTSTISDTRELILPVVRPKPQVPPRPLVSDRASQTPFRTAEDEDTEEEAERSRRAHAPRPRQHLISDSGDDWHGLNGPEYPMDTSTEDEGSRIRNQFSTFGQGTVIASPLVVRPELPQPFERADVVMGQGERPVLPSNYPIAMPIDPRPPVAHRQGPALRNLQVQPLTSGSASGQFNSSGRIRQPANGASDIEAEIYAARASISQAQEQQNNWIQSLNAEQERRLRAARLYSQQQNSNRGVKAGGVSGANMPVNFPHIGQAAGLQSAQHARQGVSDISKARQPTGQRLPSAETLGNVPAMRPMYPVPQGAQNGVQLVRQASPVTNVSTLRGAVPLNTMSVPSAARQPQASLHSNAMQLQILQENRTLEKQNDALAELYARQNSQVQLRRQPANQPHIKPVSQEGMQLQLQEALRQQQLRERQFQMQMHQERMRRLREEQEKKKLEEQMKELEKQQQQIQERKKLILQQQIALQQKHLREQQLQQQQIREQQQQHQMQTGQASQASQQVQLQLKQQQQQQQLRQVHMQQQRLARPQRSQQQQVQQQQIRQQPLRQVQRQQRQMQQRPQQQLQSGHPQAQQQVGQRQHIQGHNVSAVQQSNIALGQSPVPGQANVSNISSVLPAQVASFSSALFSLNGTQGAGSHPRNQAIPASAPRASTLRAPSSAQSSVLPPSARPKVASSQYSNQRAQGVSPATRTAGVPAFQASSTVVAGNVQSVVGHGTNGRNAVSKNGQPGGSAPQAKRELLMNSGAAPGPTLSSATTNTSGEQPKRGRGRPRGSKNRLALPGPRPVATPIAPTSAAQAILPRTAAPVMTLLPDGTQILAIPLVRGNLNAGTEMGVAAQTAATAPVAPAAPAVRLNKRALLLWDAENLGGQNKRTKP